MKFAKPNMTFLSKSKVLGFDPRATLMTFVVAMRKGRAHLQHNIDFLLLDRAVRQDQFTDVVDVASSHLPTPNMLSRIAGRLFRSVLGMSSAKGGVQPIYQSFFSVRNTDKGLIANATSILARAFRNADGSFAVNDAGKVRSFSNRMLSLFCHGTSPVNVAATITGSEFNLHPQRLTERTRVTVK